MNMEKDVPYIRFNGFTDTWEHHTIGEFDVKTGPFGSLLHADDYVEKGIPIVTTEHFKNGVLPDTGSGVPQVSENDALRLKQYELCEHDIVFSRVGSVDLNAEVLKKHTGWLFSGRVLRVRLKDQINSSFLHYELGTEHVRKSIIERSVGLTMASINTNILCETGFHAPALLSEQGKLGNYLGKFDNYIRLCLQKYEMLLKVKETLLEKMFPFNGQDIPEIRFSGFINAWKQYKFSDLVLIERGGSPRPIENYLTDAPNGLNWVKIGDAPSQGRYITKTLEKIKPDGLSKTRQVQPGDLILSNSMSFGKPYIMGIHGCIHDGWLLIRDTRNIFDLKFLCHMLGSRQMINQYRMFASGSTVNNLNKELVGSATVYLPEINEQRKIGECLESIDRLIVFQQLKCEKLMQLKESMVEKMFV